MTFVLSKQYSDSLSDSVLRGNKRSIEDGKYINKAKHGYYKDRNGFLRPDGNNYSLIVDAFKMRLERKTLDEVAEHLNSHGYTRTNTENGKVYIRKIDKEKVRRLLRDPIYTGVIQYGKNEALDLVETYGFLPAVSVEDFMTINKLDKKSDLFKLSKSYKKGKEVVANLLRHKVICAECGEFRTPSITSKISTTGVKTRYFFYRCDTEGCKFEHKSTRAKVIIEFVKSYLAKKPFSNYPSYQHYSEEFNLVSKDRLKDKVFQLREAKFSLTALDKRVSDLKENMVTEKDYQVKEYQKEDLKKTQEKIYQQKDLISKIENEIEAVKSTPLTYQEFLELFDNIAETIDKTSSMADLDYLLGKVFLNFTVNKKNVEEYTLNEPFASLERLETGKVSNGAR